MFRTTRGCQNPRLEAGVSMDKPDRDRIVGCGQH